MDTLFTSNQAGTQSPFHVICDFSVLLLAVTAIFYSQRTKSCDKVNTPDQVNMRKAIGVLGYIIPVLMIIKVFMSKNTMWYSGAHTVCCIAAAALAVLVLVHVDKSAIPEKCPIENGGGPGTVLATENLILTMQVLSAVVIILSLKHVAKATVGVVSRRRGGGGGMM